MKTKLKPISPTDSTTIGSRRPLLAGIAALALLLAACGSDAEEVVAGAAGDDNTEQIDPEQIDTEQPDDVQLDDMKLDDGGDTGTDDGTELTPTESHPELISAQPALISEVVTIDENTLGVRYEAGAEPCALANVLVTETDAAVEVALETGLNPNAAAMSCIAQVFNYEIQVSLDQPLGDREIVVVAP